MHSDMRSLAQVFGGREALGRGSAAGGRRGDWGPLVCATWPLPSAGQATPLSQSRPDGWGHASGKRSCGEYAMLPRSTHTRSGRNPGGRGQESQRLVGRALRTAVVTKNLGSRQITVDCDVIQADRGTCLSDSKPVSLQTRGFLAHGLTGQHGVQGAGESAPEWPGGC